MRIVPISIPSSAARKMGLGRLVVIPTSYIDAESANVKGRGGVRRFPPIPRWSCGMDGAPIGDGETNRTKPLNQAGMRGLRGGFLSSVTRPVSFFALRPWQQGRDHEGDRVYFATCFVLLRTWG